MPRVAVLISGRGSNMQALLAAARQPGFPAEIVLVLANDPGAAGLVVARDAGVPADGIEHRGFASREDFEAAIEQRLLKAEIDLVCLAGFMRVLGPGFVGRWTGRMINIHPSLLPVFRGLHTHARALEAGVRIHGCTVHYVVPEVDAGPIIAQAAVPVLPDDTPESLGARVLAQEHRLYPHALALVASGAARLEGGWVALRATTGADRALVVPDPA